MPNVSDLMRYWMEYLDEVMNHPFPVHDKILAVLDQHPLNIWHTTEELASQTMIKAEHLLSNLSVMLKTNVVACQNGKWCSVQRLNATHETPQPNTNPFAEAEESLRQSLSIVNQAENINKLISQLSSSVHD